MKYYTGIQSIKLDDKIIQKAKRFAESVVHTTNYKDSNQTNLDKVTNDHLISKLGEEAVKKIFESVGKDVKGPEYTIYTKYQKSWDSDLVVDTTEVAVKTQKKSMANRFGLSWTFQSSPTRRDIILDKGDAWVVFVEYDDIEYYTCRVYPPFQIKELIFGEPKMDYLIGSKKVVYASGLLFI